MWKMSRPLLESVSMASWRLRRPMPRVRSSSARVMRSLSDRPRRSRRQTTRVSAGAKVRECPLQVRSLGGAARGVFEDLLAASLSERVALEVEGLVVGGDAGVADQHCFVSRNPSGIRLTIP